MYTIPRSHYIRRAPIHSLHSTVDPPEQAIKPINMDRKVAKQLKHLGVTWFGRRTLEGRYLSKIIHPREKIEGVVYGMHEDGFAMIVATDLRILFLDKKPMFVNEDEIDYDVVSGVKYSHAGFGSTVTLHTRIKDYTIKTMNEKCAHGFIDHIESHLVHLYTREKNYD